MFSPGSRDAMARQLTINEFRGKSATDAGIVNRDYQD